MASKPGRNDLCPCGSGKKYKQCCLINPAQGVMQVNAGKLQQALQLAHIYQTRGNAVQARLICRQVIDAYPAQPDAWHLLGVIALHEGDVELAIMQFQRALKSQPNHPEFLSNLAFAYHEQGDLVAAGVHYSKTLALAPSHLNALYNQHALLLADEQGRMRAIDNLRHVLERQPEDKDAQYMLTVLLDYCGETAQAKALLEKLGEGSALDKARVDAWRYLKSACLPLPRITGSMMQTFELALSKTLPEGLVLEFGVRHGNTIRQIAKLVDPKQPVHGFDSFEGLPEVWHHEPKGSYTTKGEIPKVPLNVTLHVGWFENTLPAFLETHAGPVRFVNVDCDIYSSTKTVLENLAPRIQVGTVIVFDEYIGNEHWREDEFKAFQEAVAQYGWQYEYLCFSVFTKQVAVRITAI